MAAFKQLSAYDMASILHDMAEITAINARVDYGVSKTYTPVEVHTVSLIAEHPGITVTDIATYWQKTKGAVSQIIKRLEEQGLICRRKDEDNDKRVMLYVTDLGAGLDAAHRQYDNQEFGEVADALNATYTKPVVDASFRMLQGLLRYYRGFSMEPPKECKK